MCSSDLKHSPKVFTLPSVGPRSETRSANFESTKEVVFGETNILVDAETTFEKIMESIFKILHHTLLAERNLKGLTKQTAIAKSEQSKWMLDNARYIGHRFAISCKLT